MITQKQYLLRKIDATRFYDSDAFYLSLADSLAEAFEVHYKKKVSDSAQMSLISQEVALNLVGYMMDVVADMGLWRAFTSHCRTLYGRPVPFFSNENYIDYELNRSDVQFLTWYSLCFVSKPGDSPLYPHDSAVLELADEFYRIMEEKYEEAPAPEGMLKTNDLEIHDPEDADAIQTLGHWVFWSSYLTVPCFKTNMELIYSQAKPNDRNSLAEIMGQAQMELPTGPLALYLREWIWLIIEGKLPPKPRHAKEPEEHPYYQKFLSANNSSRIAFFNDYRELNRFLGKALGWNPEADNLPQLNRSHDFTLLTNKYKGLLIGRDVAQCFAAENNTLYNKQYAAQNDFSLLIARGRCPIDLTLYALENNLLPDIQWPKVDNSTSLVLENADFIARCFLLQYYRAV